MKSFLLFFLLFAGLATHAQTPLKTDSVYLSGTVRNFAKHKDSANAVSFLINDIALGDQVTYRARIKSDGSYRASFVKTGTQDIMMLYDEDIAGIIVSPGDHLQISFDADHFEKTLTFEGSGAQTNQDLKQYEAAQDKEWKTLYGDDEYGRFKLLSASQKNDQPEMHKKFLADRYTKEKLFLETYLTQNKPNATFANWAATDLKYEYLENLMRYCWLHPMYNKLKTGEFKVPDAYYNFIEPAPMNDARQSVSSHFGAFVKEYGSYLLDKKLGSSYLTGADVELYLKQPPGFLRDVMLCNKFSSSIRAKHLDQLKPYLDRFSLTVSQPAFKSSILKDYENAVYKLNNYTVPITAQVNSMPRSEADSMFSKIMGKYAGKVVYVDFWATWCGPCRAEMPASKTLRDQFAGKEVVFLYLGIQSEEKTWKAMIAELNIQGEHFLLGKNDFGAMSEKLQISGIPRYLLIDKKGRVADDNAKRPDDNKLKTDIEALLAGK